MDPSFLSSSRTPNSTLIRIGDPGYLDMCASVGGFEAFRYFRE